eukprot:Clim_evm18s211 gene=Clim_evmTU18s211
MVLIGFILLGGIVIIGAGIKTSTTLIVRNNNKRAARKLRKEMYKSIGNTSTLSYKQLKELDKKALKYGDDRLAKDLEDVNLMLPSVRRMLEDYARTQATPTPRYTMVMHEGDLPPRYSEVSEFDLADVQTVAIAA